MKLICLDIDGVLNTNESCAKGQQFDSLDLDCVARVSKICKLTGAKILITSTWRKYFTLEEMTSMLKAKGLTAEIVGITPVLDRRERGDEIKAWFKKAQEPIEAFVILDDDDDMGNLFPHLVRIEDGLLDKHVEEALRILNGPSNT
jgi:hypothetical protein